MGFNHNPDGLLGSELLNIPVVSTLMYDWMHLYCVSGIWNVETGLLVECLASSDFSEGSSPRTTGVRLAFMDIFEIDDGEKHVQKKQTGDISCSASEALSVFQVLRFILCQKHRNNELNDMLPADVLQDLRRGTTPAAFSKTLF